MRQTKIDQLLKKVTVMAVLLTGLFLTGANQSNAQDCIKGNDSTKSEAKRFSTENRDCWLNRAISGDKELKGAVLFHADLNERNLKGANLEGAFLTGAKMYHVNLEGANLFRADLTNAYLHFANFTWANLIEANLDGARLISANLINSTLTDAILTQATVSRKTTKGINFAAWIKRGGIVKD